MFHLDLGQEVVCVNDSDQHVDGVTKTVYNGKHYIIRWIGVVNHPLIGVNLCVRLEGIERHGSDLAALFQNKPELCDMPFRANRFRPVKKKETDISVFKEILNKTPEMEDV